MYNHRTSENIVAVFVDVLAKKNHTQVVRRNSERVRKYPPTEVFDRPQERVDRPGPVSRRLAVRVGKCVCVCVWGGVRTVVGKLNQKLTTGDNTRSYVVRHVHCTATRVPNAISVTPHTHPSDNAGDILSNKKVSLDIRLHGSSVLTDIARRELQVPAADGVVETVCRRGEVVSFLALSHSLSVCLSLAFGFFRPIRVAWARAARHSTKTINNIDNNYCARVLHRPADVTDALTHTIRRLHVYTKAFVVLPCWSPSSRDE